MPVAIFNKMVGDLLLPRNYIAKKSCYYRKYVYGMYIIEIQKSSFVDQYTLNIGFLIDNVRELIWPHLKSPWPGPLFPRWSAVELVDPNGYDVWWDTDGGAVGKNNITLHDFANKYVIPIDMAVAANDDLLEIINRYDWALPADALQHHVYCILYHSMPVDTLDTLINKYSDDVKLARHIVDTKSRVAAYVAKVGSNR